MQPSDIYSGEKQNTRQNIPFDHTFFHNQTSISLASTFSSTGTGALLFSSLAINRSTTLLNASCCLDNFLTKSSCSIRFSISVSYDPLTSPSSFCPPPLLPRAALADLTRSVATPSSPPTTSTKSLHIDARRSLSSRTSRRSPAADSIVSRSWTARLVSSLEFTRRRCSIQISLVWSRWCFAYGNPPPGISGAPPPPPPPPPEACGGGGGWESMPISRRPEGSSARRFFDDRAVAS
mmetsp:Transcript_6851/g.15148  ORF Transcript_6851/g.15148 Transcript_6851/m.15148 type:complete len:236 (-) Transcript_6851:617-1324(-)